MSSAPGAVLFTSNNTERDSHLLLQIHGKPMSELFDVVSKRANTPSSKKFIPTWNFLFIGPESDH